MILYITSLKVSPHDDDAIDVVADVSRKEPNILRGCVAMTMKRDAAKNLKIGGGINLEVLPQ